MPANEPSFNDPCRPPPSRGDAAREYYWAYADGAGLGRLRRRLGRGVVLRLDEAEAFALLGVLSRLLIDADEFENALPSRTAQRSLRRAWVRLLDAYFGPRSEPATKLRGLQDSSYQWVQTGPSCNFDKHGDPIPVRGKWVRR